MATTTSVQFEWDVANLTGVTGYKVNYRLTGAPVWMQYETSGTSANIHELIPNRIYDFQVITINGIDNPASGVTQGINITDPNPVFSPINTAISYSFANLSADIEEYTCTIALLSSPTVILATHTLSPAVTVTDTFSGLAPLTVYQITIQPIAGPFYNTFTYSVTTTENSTCAAPLSITATLIS